MNNNNDECYPHLNVLNEIDVLKNQINELSNNLRLRNEQNSFLMSLLNDITYSFMTKKEPEDILKDVCSKLIDYSNYRKNNLIISTENFGN